MYGAMNGHASRQDIDMARVAKVYDSLIVLDKEHTALLKAHKELNEKHNASEATVLSLVGQLMNVIDKCQGNVERHEQWSVLQSRQLQHLAVSLNIKLEEMPLDEVKKQAGRRGEQTQVGDNIAAGPASYEALLAQYAVKVEHRVVPNVENQGFAAVSSKVPDQLDLDLVLSNPVEPTNTMHGKTTGHVPPREKGPVPHPLSHKTSRSASPVPVGRASGTATGAATPTAAVPAGVSVNITLPATTTDHSSGDVREGGEGAQRGDELHQKHQHQLPVVTTALGERVNALLASNSIPEGVNETGSGAVLQALVQQIAGYKEHYGKMVSDYNSLAAEHKTMMILNGRGATSAPAASSIPAAVSGIGLSEEELKRSGKTFVNKQQLHCIFQQKDEVASVQMRDLKAQIEKLRQLVTYNHKTLPENNPSYQLEPETQVNNSGKGKGNSSSAGGRASTAGNSGIRQSTSPTLPRTTLISSASGRRKPPKSAPGLETRSVESGVGFVDLGGARQAPPRGSNRALAGRKFALPPSKPSSSAQSSRQAALETRLLYDLEDPRTAPVRQPNPPSLISKPSSVVSSQVGSQLISHAQYSASVEVPATEVVIQPPRRPEAVVAGLEHDLGLHLAASEVGNTQSRRRMRANESMGNPILDQQPSMALTDSDSAAASTHGKIPSSSLFSSVSVSANSNGQPGEPRTVTVGRYVPAGATAASSVLQPASSNVSNVMHSVAPEQLWNSEYTAGVSNTPKSEENQPPVPRGNNKVGGVTGIGESFIEDMESSVNAPHSVVSELSEGSMLSEYFRTSLPATGESSDPGGPQQPSNHRHGQSSRPGHKVSKTTKLKILHDQGRLLDKSAGAKY